MNTENTPNDTVEPTVKKRVTKKTAKKKTAKKTAKKTTAKKNSKKGVSVKRKSASILPVKPPTVPVVENGAVVMTMPENKSTSKVEETVPAVELETKNGVVMVKPTAAS